MSKELSFDRQSDVEPILNDSGDAVEYPLFSDEILKRAEDTATVVLAIYKPSPAMITAVTEAILDGYQQGIKDSCVEGDPALLARLAQIEEEHAAARRIIEFCTGDAQQHRLCAECTRKVLAMLRTAETRAVTTETSK